MIQSCLLEKVILFNFRVLHHEYSKESVMDSAHSLTRTAHLVTCLYCSQIESFVGVSFFRLLWFVWLCFITSEILHDFSIRSYLFNNINSQLDATIMILLIISISWTCFGRGFRQSSGALDCVYSLWYKAPKMLPAGSTVGEDERNHRQKRVELIEIINKIIIVASS